MSKLRNSATRPRYPRTTQLRPHTLHTQEDGPPAEPRGAHQLVRQPQAGDGRGRGRRVRAAPQLHLKLVLQPREEGEQLAAGGAAPGVRVAGQAPQVDVEPGGDPAGGGGGGPRRPRQSREWQGH